MKNFDPDKFLNTASYRQVRELSPQLSGVPTLYSPDKSQIYLSSLDVVFRTDDVERLKSALRGLRETYEMAKSRSEFRRAWRARADHLEVCGLLQHLVDEPEDYGDPDDLIGENPGKGF